MILTLKLTSESRQINVIINGFFPSVVQRALSEHICLACFAYKIKLTVNEKVLKEKNQ